MFSASKTRDLAFNSKIHREVMQLMFLHSFSTKMESVKP